jgi:hypothetical protein
MTVLTDITLHVLLGAASSAATAPAAWSGPVPGQFAPETVAEVVEAMVERYVGMWYRDFTFVQTTSYYYDDENVSRTETWYESLRLPGKLRIDVAPVEQGRILMFNDDTFYQFQGGELQGSNPRVHPLLLMGFDIYFMPVDEVLEKLEGLGVDLDEMHESTWQDRPVYVLGAEEGDETSHQFWIDQERLVFVRQINGDSETQFNKYERLGGAWVSPEVVFMDGGKVTLLEEYSDMSIARELDESAFLPEGSVRPSWIPAG